MRDESLIIFNIQQTEFALLPYDTEYNRNAMYTIYNFTSLQEELQRFFSHHDFDNIQEGGIEYVVDFYDEILRRTLVIRNKVIVKERYLDWIQQLIEHNLNNSPAKKIVLLFYVDKKYKRVTRNKRRRRKRHFISYNEKEFITVLGKKEIKPNQGYIITKQ